MKGLNFHGIEDCKPKAAGDGNGAADDLWPRESFTGSKKIQRNEYHYTFQGIADGRGHGAK